MTATGEYSNVEYVFEPHASTMPNIREYVEALWARRQFIAKLAQSDLRTLRSSTALGSLWAVLDPLFQAAIYFFLYAVLRGGQSSQVKFLPVLIGDIFLFGLTQSALGEGGQSIRRAKNLMLNSTFPRALLPVTSVYKALRQFVTIACVFAVLFPLVGGTLGPGLFVLPLLFVIQIVMNVGIALLVSTFVVLVPDGTNVMAYVRQILFFATPVIYPVTLLPSSAKILVAWQPLFALFASYQAVLSGKMPSPSLVFQAALWSVAMLAIGGRIFLKREREFTIHL